MASEALTLRITAQTDEFVKKVQDAQTKVRSLSQQMSEVDKQLKTESVDRVQKLSEKLELAKRASNMAAKEAELYAEKIKKMTDTHEDASKMTDKQKEQLVKLSEQMATAQQKANTYAAEVDKLSKELDEETSASDKAATETEEMGDAVEAVGKSANDASGDIKEFSRSVLANLASAAIQKGISAVINLWKNLASAAWNAAKNMATAAKEYAKNAVDMAAGYEDALGYSEQVFGKHAENVKKWVEDNSLSLRIGESSLIDYVNKFGALFTTFGFGAQDAAENSENLIKLAVDLRAATGDDMSQIIESLTSGLTGGYKAFQRYGVVVNEARIKAQALSMGLIDVNVNQLDVEKATLKVTEANKKASEALQKHGEDSIEYQKAQIAIQEAEEALTKALGGKEIALDDVSKKMAILAILQGDLAFADGQAAKESESYSSQLALKDTLLENLQLRIGEKLLPIFTEFITKVNDFMQSDAGKAVMDALTEAVGLLADKNMELLNDERMTAWINDLTESVPKVTKDFLDFTGQISELIPEILDLTEKLLVLFGIKTEAEKAKDALYEHRKEVDELAKTYNTSTDTIITAIATFAEENNLEMSEVLGDMEYYAPAIQDYLSDLQSSYTNDTGDMWSALSDFARENGITLRDLCNDWSSWEPQIISYAESLGDDYSQNFTDALDSFRNFAADNNMELGQVLSDWQNQNIDIVAAYDEYVSNTASMEDAVIQEIASLGPDTQSAIDSAVNSVSLSSWDNFWRGVKKTASDVWDFIQTATSPSAWESSGFQITGGVRASGGSVRAGQMYRVNDDNGRRIETFVPNVDGYILNGNDTQRVINNSTNNSKTYGDLNVYVNSYGTDAASIADEIGAALNQKLRMAGSW